MGGKPSSYLHALDDFKGLKHRLENFLSFKTIDFIDDSKATNFFSLKHALLSIKEKYDEITILIGGAIKDCDYKPLIDEMLNYLQVLSSSQTDSNIFVNIKAFYLFSDGGAKILSLLKQHLQDLAPSEIDKKISNVSLLSNVKSS